ncbi:MAG: hypothetical protein LBU35_03615, partial [Holosporales bacterium]|nr:hypothetical protein [Holosporales bacterium]
MNQPKIKSKTPGVRYYEHPVRKHGVRFDKYFTIRYRLNGKVKEEALGWESQGWSERKAGARLSELKENHRTGVGAKTLADKRKTETQRRKLAEEAEGLAKRENISFASVFEKYMEQALQDKNNRTCLDEQSKFNKWLAPLFGGDMPMKDISPFILEKLKKQMSEAG